MPKATVRITTEVECNCGRPQEHQPSTMTFDASYELGGELGEYAGSLQKAITLAAERANRTLQPMVKHPGRAS